jgi:uncharacterized membrane protein YozB (DUF420 family)
VSAARWRYALLPAALVLPLVLAMAAALAAGPALAHWLPSVNALLNATATVLLLAGYWLIRRGQVAGHRNAMLAAFGVSILFLTSYLVYHAQVGSVCYPGTGILRGVYLAILVTHVVLAAAVPFLAVVTIYLGLRNRREKHRKLARWTFPIWLYVSVTGVVIYLMLYRLPA